MRFLTYVILKLLITVGLRLAEMPVLVLTTLSPVRRAEEFCDRYEDKIPEKEYCIVIEISRQKPK